MNKLILITSILIAPLIASGEVLDKTSFFSVDQDSITGKWTAVCESEVTGIDRSQTYIISLELRPSIYGIGAYDIVKMLQFELGPDQRSYADAVEGVFDLEIKKLGQKLTISITGYIPLARTGDSVKCSIHIGRAGIPNQPLHSMQFVHDILHSGEPSPAT